MSSGAPGWVQELRRPDVEVRKQRGHWYAYRIESVYDPNIKRSRKVTKEYLGKATPDGIIPPRRKLQAARGRVREAGNHWIIHKMLEPVLPILRTYWPESWQTLAALASVKLAKGQPLKRAKFHYDTSLAADHWPEARMSKNSLTRILASVGSEWGSQIAFFQEAAKDTRHVAIDLSHMAHQGRANPLAERGYSGKRVRGTQVRLLLMWGLDTQRPGLLRILPGSVNDAPSLLRAVMESGFQDVTVIGDRGFYSEPNVEALEDHDVHYVLALRRDLDFLEHPAASRYRGHFAYRGRTQWWREYAWGGRRIVHYLDKTLAAREEDAFLKKVRKGKATMAEYRAAKPGFGTLALLTDTGLDPRELYELYKQRNDIETAFDALKNTLEADRSHMQNQHSLQGYLFVLWLALYAYAGILEHLKRKELTNKYGVLDVLEYASKIQVSGDGDDRIVHEVPKQARDMEKALELSITENLGS